MVQLTTKKTALVLYGVLLVLPTAVLAGLHWFQLYRDHRGELDRVPRDVADAARRLSAEIERRVSDTLERESARPFFVYRDVYYPIGTIGSEIALVPSPLTQERPQEVLAWFAHNVRDDLAGPRVFGMRQAGDAPDDGQGDTRGDTPDHARDHARGDGWSATEAGLQQALFTIIDRDIRADLRLHEGMTRFTRWRESNLPATTVAINLHPDDDIDCLRSEIMALRDLAQETMLVRFSAFHLRFYREPDGTPRIVGTRRVIVDPNPDLADIPSCVDTMRLGGTLLQGFFLDPNWYFHDLPRAAAEAVLEPDQVFVPPGEEAPAGVGQLETATIRPVELLGSELYDDRDAAFGEMCVALNTGDLEARFRSQSLRFLGVAAMLFVSLGTGLALLLRSVRRDLDQVARTENFVAAVTHELRTPLAAVKLYAEMLVEGWVQEDEKREEYYRRIAREADRLELLVERVLEKGKVTSDEAPPQPGDLSRAVQVARGTLVQLAAERQDLTFRLANDLPEVLLIPDGVRSILTNLVENARKYAPVGADPEAEAILIRTRMLRNRVVLEVLDRGPGIPASERTRIFEAFYRIGNESTRTASGTGLGLHLVALQMRAMRGRIQVLDREGGGTVFRMTFRKAEGSETDYDVL